MNFKLHRFVYQWTLTYFHQQPRFDFHRDLYALLVV